MDSVIITDGQFTILGLPLDVTVTDDSTGDVVTDDISGDPVTNG